MEFKKIINIVYEFIISQYNRFINFVKTLVNKKQEINNQTTDNNIHVINAKVKKVKIKNMKTNYK